MFTPRCALWTALRADETGFIISSELVLIATVGVIGMTAAMACVRDSVVGELNDVAGAFGNLNQSYCYTGFSAASPQCCKSRTVGSCFTDQTEDVSLSRVDIQAQSYVVPCPTPAAVGERVIDERIIEERVIESSDEAVCPAVVEPGVASLAAPCAGATVTSAGVAVAGSCQTCETRAADADPCTEPRPIHAAKTQCGELLHYSETSGKVVRLIDEVDAIHRPHVTPSVSLW